MIPMSVVQYHLKDYPNLWQGMSFRELLPHCCDLLFVSFHKMREKDLRGGLDVFQYNVIEITVDLVMPIH